MKKMLDYLEEDRERVLGSLQGAASPEDAQRVLEKEADRLLLQYNESCTSLRVREEAAGMMQAVRSSVPFLDSMGEARIWRSREAGPGGAAGGIGSKAEKKGPGLSGILLGIGAVLTAAAFFLPAVLTGGSEALPALLRGVLPMIAGGGCLYLAGRTAGKNAVLRIGGGAGGENAQERIEITVDPEKLWNSLRGAVMVVDRNLEIARESEEYDRGKETAAGVRGGKGLSAEEIELFAGLLEMADAGGDRTEDAAGLQPGDEAAAQMAADIRYYLHKRDVEAVDWSPSRAAWFEMLPALPGTLPAGKRTAAKAAEAGKTGSGDVRTLRPALVQGGKLLKKGVAVR